GRNLAMGCADTTILLWNVQPLQVMAQKLEATDLDRLWVALAGDDGARAHEAIARLASAPGATLPLLKTRVQAGPRDPPPRIKQLMVDLGSEMFRVRQAAYSELEKIGWAAEAALRQALTEKPNLDYQRRIEALLERISAGKLTPEELRLVRAMQVLEQI